MKKYKEIKIKKKFAYSVSEEAIQSVPVHAPLDSNPIESNKKQFNKMPNNRRNNNLVVIEPGTKELFLSVPLRFKNSFHFSYLPDTVSLFLHLAYGALSRIINLEEWLATNYQAGTMRMLPGDNNYHQKKFGDVITVIVFLIMAIEALTNEILPEKATADGKEMTKSEMEKKLSLDAKFKVLRSSGTDINKTLSEKVFYVKKLRDDIVHFKSHSTDLNQVKSVYPFDEILNLNIRDYFDSITMLIDQMSPNRIEFIEFES